MRETKAMRFVSESLATHPYEQKEENIELIVHQFIEFRNKIKDYFFPKVCNCFNVPKNHLSSSVRKREYAEARFALMNVLRNECNLDYKTIGYLLGGKDHSTIIHGVKTHNDLVQFDKKYKQNYELLKEYLK